jgi:hypothetical protein
VMHRTPTIVPLQNRTHETYNTYKTISLFFLCLAVLGNRMGTDGGLHENECEGSLVFFQWTG